MMRSFENLGFQFIQVKPFAHQSHRLLIAIAGEIEPHVAVRHAQRDRMSVDSVRYGYVSRSVLARFEMDKRRLARLVKEWKRIFLDPIFRIGHSRRKRTLNLYFYRGQEVEELGSIHPVGHTLKRDVASLLPFCE